MHCGKDCIKKFVELNQDEVKLMYAMFPKQPMVELTDVLKREHEAGGNITSSLKSLMTLRTVREEITS